MNHYSTGKKQNITFSAEKDKKLLFHKKKIKHYSSTRKRQNITFPKEKNNKIFHKKKTKHYFSTRKRQAITIQQVRGRERESINHKVSLDKR